MGFSAALVGACSALSLDHTDAEIAAMPLHQSTFWTYVIGEPQHGGLCYFAGATSYSIQTRTPYLEELGRRGFDEFEVDAVARRTYYQGMRAQAFRCARGYPFNVTVTVDREVWLYCDTETDPDTDEFRCIEESERRFVFYNDARLWDWH
jgi:hypothetical protein